MRMQITETLYVKDRGAWRKWLSRNHNKKKEIWLIYYKKSSGKQRILYDNAVEEALCFGWIDSTVKRIDEERYAQRYSPRNKGSIWAESNRKRVRKMIAEGKMTPAGLKAFSYIKKSKNQPTMLGADSLILPDDLKKALEKNKKAWRNFQNFAPTHRKLYIWWVATAKRPETRKKRIKITVKRCAGNKKPNEM